MKNVNWSPAIAIGAILLVLFIVWGSFGGWSGSMMGPGWGMMGAGFAGMVFLGLAFVAFFALLFFWVVRELAKKNYPAFQTCPSCGIAAPASALFCPHCGTSLD